MSRPRSKSLEQLYPRAKCESRQASAPASAFTLICTIVGGGILSLPFGIEKCGLILGPLMLLLSALASDFTCYILVSSARRTGARTYEEVAMFAFNKKFRIFVLVLLFITTYFSCVGYAVLSGELLSPVVQYVFHALKPDSSFDFTEPGHRHMVMIAAIGLISPVTVARSLSKLKFVSLMAIFSCCVLCCVVIIKTVSSPHMHSTTIPNGSDYLTIDLWPASFSDVVFTFPIFSIAFLCHFNVIAMHSELKRPTRGRARMVLHATMGISSLLYLVVGIFGLLWARQGVCGNILLNFFPDDVLVTVGRGCLGLTILGSYPLLVLPCRTALDRIIRLIRFGTAEWDVDHRTGEQSDSESDADEDTVERPLLSATSLGTAPPLSRAATPIGDVFGKEPQGEAQTEDDVKAETGIGLLHVLKTLFIVSSSLLVAALIPGILVVWTFMGSTICLVIAYIFPCIFYLKVRRHKGWTIRSVAAAFLLVLSAVAGVACTYEAAMHAGDPQDPDPVTQLCRINATESVFDLHMGL